MPRPGAARTQWASLGTIDQTNMGTENLSTMYSEAEPRSRASGTSGGILPVIPHHGPSTRLWLWGPTSHEDHAPHEEQGCRRRSGGCVIPASALPRGCHCSWRTLHRKPELKNHKHLMQPHLVGRPVGAWWRRRPLTSTLSV